MMKLTLQFLMMTTAIVVPLWVIAKAEPGESSGRRKPVSETESSALVVFLGDSITAGFGVEREQAYPAVLEKRFLAEKRKVKIINAGLSGSTSASGPSRVLWQVKAHPTHIVLALGANDALRGIKPHETEVNLAKTIELAQGQGIKMILVGMKAPPNMGKDFDIAFAAIYERLATKFQVPLLPFLLEGVAGEARWNQADGIHPNAQGQEKIADRLYEFLRNKI